LPIAFEPKDHVPLPRPPQSHLLCSARVKLSEQRVRAFHPSSSVLSDATRHAHRGSGCSGCGLLLRAVPERTTSLPPLPLPPLPLAPWRVTATLARPPGSSPGSFQGYSC